MSDKSAIEWTDATWQPVTGCSRVSAGCEHCYAERMARRLDGRGIGYDSTTKQAPNGPRWSGQINLHPDRLEQPLRWRKPRRVFVCSMGDLFHEDVPFDFIWRVFRTMAASPEHAFQVLTKRPERMAEFLELVQRADALGDGSWYGASMDGHQRPICAWDRWPLPNVWLGTSVEDQATADERIPHLLRCPAEIRFISAEPLLASVALDRRWRFNSSMRRMVALWARGEVDRAKDEAERFASGAGTRIDWVIAGGESGPGARPMHPAWARSLRDQCAQAGVPFFFKQWGEWAPNCLCVDRDAPHRTIPRPYGAPRGVMFRCGKKAAGRLLDGREHNEFPEVARA